jgi:hypothetical protein
MNHQSKMFCATPRSVGRVIGWNPMMLCGATLHALEVVMR